MNTTQYKELKGINKTKRNLRDSIGKLELAITNLAEVMANEMHTTNNSFGLEELKDDVQEAGKIKGKARRDIEENYQIEGTAKILEHSFNEKNKRFLNKFKQVHENSYNEYSALEDEVVIEINPIFIEI